MGSNGALKKISAAKTKVAYHNHHLMHQFCCLAIATTTLLELKTMLLHRSDESSPAH
jgi:hypothetical protein